ncbi:MAG: bifunctional demethylmenaquinone methyltransferase/2-methoxy-6-polyprenyl-1,4-benzoquinol methylase UbiE [Pirellulaceae bacterium]
MLIDKSNQRVRQMFGEIAAKYDRMNHLLSMNVDRLWRRKTVRMVRPLTNAPILDVCTGTGDLAIALYKEKKGKATVVGADFCREMLEIGERKRIRRGFLENFNFVEADAQALPFESGSFQLVTVAFGLRNVADTDLGLREMTRVCAPDGKVAVLEFSMPTRQPFRGFYRWYFKNILPRIGQLFARNASDAYAYLPDTVEDFPCGQALVSRMEAAGLTSVEFHPLTMGIATLYIGRKI